MTERKRFELHLRQAAELNKLLLAEMDMEGLSVAVVESAHKILPLDYASLLLRESGSATLRLKAQRGVLDAGRSTGAGQALAALVAETRRQSRCSSRGDLESLGEPVQALLDAGVAVVCCLPLVTAQGTLGALIVGSASPEAFSDHDVTLLQQLSTYVAIAIQNARFVRGDQDAEGPGVQGEALSRGRDSRRRTISPTSSARARQSTAFSGRSRPSRRPTPPS